MNARRTRGACAWAWAAIVAAVAGCSSAPSATHSAAPYPSRQAGATPVPDAGPRQDATGTLEGTPAATLAITTRCATAMVVGLTWNAVSGATSYAVARGGASLASTASPGFSDGSVAPVASYTYTVTALGAGGQALATAAQAVTTPAASTAGDAPYCPSTLVRSATWNWASGFNQQNGSDLWPSTWGADGSTYLFFGDGGGFFGSNTAGRASFGVARLTGTNPAVTDSDASNVYGGLNAAHPSRIDGKAGSILAVGNDFYALGGVYRDGDSGGPSGSPNHCEIVSSMGDAYSWQDSSWDFCAADAEGNVTQGPLCATSFVHFGQGNAAAFDGYVYLTANPAAGWFSATPTPGPASTYMMRAPNDALTTQSAYTYYAGLDATGAPVWSAAVSDAQPIFTDRNERAMGLGNLVYDAGLGRIVGVAQGAIVAETAVYEAPNPWGPWSVIRYDNTNPDGSGGFGGLGSSAYAPGHGDSLGVNFVEAWTSPDGLTLWAVFSSDGQAPTTTLLPGLAGNDMDSFSLVSLTLGM